MKKKFIVEIEYEPTYGDVLYDTGLEIIIGYFMDGYVEKNTIKKDFKVKVEEKY